MINFPKQLQMLAFLYTEVYENKNEYVLNGNVTGKKKIPQCGVELTPSHEEELKTCPMQGLRSGRYPRKG